MFNGLNAVSEASLVVVPPWANGWLIAAVLLSVAQHLGVIYFLSNVFGTGPLSAADMGVCVALSMPVLLVEEVLKAVAATSGPGRASPRARAGDELREKLLPSPGPGAADERPR